MNAKDQPEDLGFWKAKAVEHRTQFERNSDDDTAAMLLMFAEDMIEEIEESVFVN